MANEHFLPPREPFATFNTDFTDYFNVIAVFAFILGGGNLLRVHLNRVSAGHERFYSLVTLIAFFGVLVAGLFKIGVPDGEAYNYPDGWFMHIYDSTLYPLNATMFSLLAFFVASAAFRANLRPVFDSYFAIQRALAGDDEAAAREAVAQLQAVLESIDESVLRPQALRVWQEERTLLTKALLSCLSSNTMKGLRSAFLGVARAAISLEKAFFVGDRPRDIAFGLERGAAAVLIGLVQLSLLFRKRFYGGVLGGGETRVRMPAH